MKTKATTLDTCTTFTCLTKILSTKTTLLSLFLLLQPGWVPADNLDVTISDNLNQQFTGNANDRSASRQITALSTDIFFLRNGMDSASFNYRITGQVSADNGFLSGSSDSARLLGNVNFNFDLPIALWNVTAQITFRGVQDSAPNAGASAGQLSLSSSGSVSSLTNLSLSSGSNTSFDRRD